MAGHKDYVLTDTYWPGYWWDKWWPYGLPIPNLIRVYNIKLEDRSMSVEECRTLHVKAEDRKDVVRQS